MCLTEYNEEETMQMFREEGRREGLERGIYSLVGVYKKVGGSISDAVESVMNDFGWDENRARLMVEKYWNA